jgi:hypothetical protein
MAAPGAVYVAKKAATKANPLAASVFVQSDSSSKAAAVYVPDQWQDNTVASSLAFRIRAYGRATGGTTTNLTIALQSGTSTTAGSNTDTITSGAVAWNSASGPWMIYGDFVWDVTSKKVSGIAQQINVPAGTIVAQAASTQLTSIDYSTNGLGFVVSAFFSATNANNLVTLDGFSLEVL